MKTESISESVGETRADAQLAGAGSGGAVLAPGSGRVRRRTVGGAVAVVMAVVAVIAALVVVYGRPGDGSKTPNIPRVALGFDGIPNQIDGHRVYRIGDEEEWQTLAGSFLLGAWPQLSDATCPPRTSPGEGVSDDLVQGCGGYQLRPRSDPRAGSGGAGGSSLAAAPRGAGVLRPWANRLVIVRVHTHDREASGCSEAMRAACDATVVAEEVVWPIVPTEFEGERVFRAADSETYGTMSRSFLFGGIVAGGFFGGFSVDGESIAQQCRGIGSPMSSGALWSDGDIVVVRAHVNDPISGRCPDLVYPARTIVLESVDWWYDPYAAPYAIIPRTSAQVGPSVGPIGPDGIPLDIDGRRVYSGRSGLPSDSGFLLGGRAAPAESCPTDPPSPNQNGASSSACGDWFVGGTPVNVLDGILSSLKGKLIVVDVVRTRVLSTCATTSSPCGQPDVLVVTSVVWAEPSAQGTPTPGAP